MMSTHSAGEIVPAESTLALFPGIDTNGPDTRSIMHNTRSKALSDREAILCVRRGRVVSGTSEAKEAAFLVLNCPSLKSFNANCTLSSWERESMAGRKQ